MNRDGMSCSCVLGDDAIVVRWCAAHARTYRKAIADERERCARAVEQWQPSETAPKDGTRVLLLTKLGDGTLRVDLGHWPTRKIFDQHGDGDPIEPRWCESDHIPLWREATHWMPLPPTQD